MADTPRDPPGLNEQWSDEISALLRRRRGPMSQFFSSDTLPARTTAPTPDPPPFGSRVDDYFDNLGGSGHCADTILVGAGLTVY